MNVSLTPHLESMVRQKVASGRYNNASEVVREALRLMEEHDQHQRLRSAVAIGQEQVKRGETQPFTPELMERLKNEAIEDARAGKPIPDEVRP
ncbi:MAG: type II toxin-antitoxin system ParD family antitoxin [Thermomicrobiales bacterium]